MADQKELCQAFNAHISVVALTFDTTDLRLQLNNPVTTSVASHGHSFFILHPFSPYIVSNALTAINLGKNTGEDGLDSYVLGLATLVIVEHTFLILPF